MQIRTSVYTQLEILPNMFVPVYQSESDSESGSNEAALENYLAGKVYDTQKFFKLRKQKTFWTPKEIRFLKYELVLQTYRRGKVLDSVCFSWHVSTSGKWCNIPTPSKQDFGVHTKIVSFFFCLLFRISFIHSMDIFPWPEKVQTSSEKQTY